MIVTIVAMFTDEPALGGEKAEIITKPNFLGEVKARLLGDSDYIRNNTDGFVILYPGDYII